MDFTLGERLREGAAEEISITDIAFFFQKQFLLCHRQPYTRILFIK